MHKIHQLAERFRASQPCQSEVKKHSTLSKVARYFSYFLLFALLSLALLILVAPSLWGTGFYTITGSSMGSALPVGSIAIAQPVAASQIEVGDIIAYRAAGDSGTMVTHRVVKVIHTNGDLSFQTRGDSNEDVDPNLVPPTNVIGKVSFHIPLVGYLFHFIRQPLGYVLLIGLPAIAIIIFEFKSLAGQIGASKKKKAQKVL